MADRIDKYRTDCTKFQDTATANVQKVKSELASLNKWVIKHQHETVADGDKAKLLATLQFYFKLSTDRDGDEVKEAVFKLLDDFLKLPEGKLVTAKGKQGALRWLQTLDAILNPGQATSAPTVSPADGNTRYGVADISVGDGNVTLMDLTTNCISDLTLTITDTAMLSKITEAFDDLGYLEIVVRNGLIIQALDMDGNEQNIKTAGE